MVSRAARAAQAVALEPTGLDGATSWGDAPGTDGAIALPVDGEPGDATITEDDDGGAIIDLNPSLAPPIQAATQHDANLAEFIPEETLSEIANDVIEGMEVDKKSRQEWETVLSRGLDLLGMKFQDRTYPFTGASGVVDPMLLEAVIRSLATATAELLPATGPVKTTIIGEPTQDLENQATRQKVFFNSYLLGDLQGFSAPEWVDQTEQLLLWRAFAGSTFRKTYQDPILNRPVSPVITPDKLIVSYFSDPDMETCARVSHLVPYSEKELRQLQLSGFYRDIVVGDPSQPMVDGSQNVVTDKVDSVTGMQKPQDGGNPQDADKEYEFIEQHVDYDLPGFEHEDFEYNDDVQVDGSGQKTGLPLPYIITVDPISRKVLAIRRNWEEGDFSYQKEQYFTHFKFLPGFGFYGIGYAHILGNNAQTGTSLLRQMIDAATLEMFPGGLRMKGMRNESNNLMVGPCEFIEVETGGLPIQHAIMTMPYNGPSEVSLQLYIANRDNAQKIASTTELSVGDGRQDAPVGTTLALLEAANRLMSATIKNAHRGLRSEFKKIARLFGKYLPDVPYPFPVPGGTMSIMRADFSDKVDVVPVSDPNITSYAQRVTRADAIKQTALQYPMAHNAYQVCKNYYEAIGVPEIKINSMLPAPQQAQPMDPLSENENALKNMPLAAGLYQDHAAHIQAHQPLAEQLPALMAHIAEHMGMQMRMKVQMVLGIELPPPGTKLPPAIENQIAVLVAQAMQVIGGQGGENPTPEQIAMEQIRVEAQKVAASIQATKASVASKAYSEQMANQREQMKLENARVIQSQKDAAAMRRERLKLIGQRLKFNERKKQERPQ